MGNYQNEAIELTTDIDVDLENVDDVFESLRKKVYELHEKSVQKDIEEAQSRLEKARKLEEEARRLRGYI